MSIVLWLLSAHAADTGLADVSGSASPSEYGAALQRALVLELEERGFASIAFNGSARGTPMLGVTASGTATVTCADGAEHPTSVSGLKVPLGRETNNWQGIGKQVADRLVRDVDCAAAPAPKPEPPPEATVAEVKPDARVSGSASPDSFSTALTGAFGRALDGRPEISALKFYGSAKGSPVVGISANAGADVTCGGTTHELMVEDVSEPLGEGGSWAAFADTVVERLLRDLKCS